MRKIIRHLFGWSLLIVISLLWFDPISYIENYNEKQFSYNKKKNARGSITYILKDSKWLTFAIPTYVNRLKYIATANLFASIEQEENIYDIRYSIRYELLDSRGEVIYTKVYNLRTSHIKFVDKNGVEAEKFFYLKGSLKPTLGQDFIIDLSLYRDAKKIRLRLEDYDSRIADIGVRSYQEEKISHERRKSVWKRMSRSQREKIARGNIYDLTMMRKEEKYNLLSSLWKPNGPLGVEGETYQIRRLFVVVGEAADEIYFFVPFQSNFYADENISATRYLAKGKYELSVTPLHKEPIYTELKLYNDYLLLQQKQFLLENEKKIIYFETQEDGVVEIVSSRGVTLTLLDANSKKSIETPALLSSGYYDVNATTAISYHFYSPQKRYLRVECRSQDSHLSSIKIQMSDSNEQVVHVVDKNISLLTSRYDYLESFKPISEPTYLYITLPSNIQKIDISAQTRLSVRLSTRSEHSSYPIYSFIDQERVDEVRLASWFPIRPKNFNEMSIKNRETKLYKQKRPPRINPLIEMGEFDYEQLYPTHRWSAYELLLKRGLDNQYIRSQSWGSISIPLQPMQDEKLLFYNDVGLKDVSPTLIYSKKEDNEDNISLYIDNKLIDSYTLYSTQGMIKLPTLKVNQSYLLRVESREGIDLFVTNSASISPLYMKRSFITFDKPMQFIVEKKLLEESIGVQLAVADISKKGLYDINMTIEGAEPIEKLVTTSLTFKSYRLHADVTQQKAVDISRQHRDIQLSDTQFLTLGENLKSGLYIITLYPPKDLKDVYVLVNHILLGKKSKIRISKESY